MALVLNQKDKKVKLIFRTVDDGLSLNLADETDQVIYQVNPEDEKAILDYLLGRAGLVAASIPVTVAEETRGRIAKLLREEEMLDFLMGRKLSRMGGSPRAPLVRRMVERAMEEVDDILGK